MAATAAQRGCLADVDVVAADSINQIVEMLNNGMQADLLFQ